MCSNAYDDVTDFEVCAFIKTQKSKQLENERLFFLPIKNSFITRGYSMATYNFNVGVRPTIVIILFIVIFYCQNFGTRAMAIIIFQNNFALVNYG